MEGLKKFGINVKEYFNKDEKTFKGEGGVDGIIGLTKAMKAHGLDIRSSWRKRDSASTIRKFFGAE